MKDDNGNGGNRATLIFLSRIEILVGVVVGLIAIVGAVGSWFVLPYRVSVVEKAVSAISAEQTSSRELLIRIDESTKNIKEELRIVKEQLQARKTP